MVSLVATLLLAAGCADASAPELPARLEFSDAVLDLDALRSGEVEVTGSATVLGVDGGTRTDVALPGAHPHGVTFGRDPGVAYVTWEGGVGSWGGVAALDLDGGRLLWQTEVGAFTLGVAWLEG